MTNPPQPPGVPPEGRPGPWMPPEHGNAVPPSTPGPGPSPTPGPPPPGDPPGGQPAPGPHPPSGPASVSPTGHGPAFVPPVTHQQQGGGSIWLGLAIGFVVSVVPWLILWLVPAANEWAWLGWVGVAGLIGGLIGGIVLTVVRKTRLTGAGILIFYGILPLIAGGVCVGLFATL